MIRRLRLRLFRPSRLRLFRPSRLRPLKPSRLRLLGAALAVLAVATLGVTLAAGLRTGHAEAGASSAGPATDVRDEPAPALAGRALTGARFDLAALRGHVVLVNAWASWCDPCRQELPLLVAAARRWSGQGLRLVGIDVRDDDAQARALLDEVNAARMTVVPDPAGTVAVGWGVRGLPETFVVDRQGRIRLWALGPLTADWLERRIPPLLAS